jgi:hypothetical protein
MDMWGVGCVFFEIVSLFPLFPGTNGTRPNVVSSMAQLRKHAPSQQLPVYKFVLCPREAMVEKACLL